MNERIRQFELESHIDVYALGKDRAKWESVLQKFAELIVKECAEIALREDHDPYECIKQHFGIE